MKNINITRCVRDDLALDQLFLLKLHQVCSIAREKVSIACFIFKIMRHKLLSTFCHNQIANALDVKLRGLELYLDSTERVGMDVG